MAVYWDDGRNAWYDDGRNAWYDDGRNAWYTDDGRNAVYYLDERNAAFGEEWGRNAFQQVYNPRTRRWERRWVPDAAPTTPRPVAMVPTTPSTPVVVQQGGPAAPSRPMPPNVTCGKSAFRNEFGQVKTGLIIDAIAQSLAAFAPLPAAPVPTGNIADDQANSITFLAALAGHAKRDEQIRTISKLVQLFVN